MRLADIDGDLDALDLQEREESPGYFDDYPEPEFFDDYPDLDDNPEPVEISDDDLPY